MIENKQIDDRYSYTILTNKDNLLVRNLDNSLVRFM